MQPLEEDKDPFKVLWGNPQAIVANGKDPFAVTVFRGRDVYTRYFGAAILDCVPDEVLKYLSQLGFVRHESRQRIVSDNRTALLERGS